MYLTREKLKEAALLYCERTGQKPDKLLFDPLTMAETLPRWEMIRDRMASNQEEMRAMLDVV
uniref:Uncharacterized protein n=1 Tax=viral metagenome TaxID=1070528 RepID=A0A6M3LN89_9ZZZZ